jgi:hypothetical protein
VAGTLQREVRAEMMAILCLLVHAVAGFTLAPPPAARYGVVAPVAVRPQARIGAPPQMKGKKPKGSKSGGKQERARTES